MDWKIQPSKEDIQHYGTPGQKWGDRKYQYEDGTYTELGKERRRKGGKFFDKLRGFNYNKAASKVKTSEQMVNESKNVVNKSKNISNRFKKPLDLSNMSNQDLQNYITRQSLEAQYTQLYNANNMKKGEAITREFLDTAGDVLAVTGSALAIALSIKALTSNGN